uniref:O-methyltransferase C-terminal domain-containing protein n=1 Tax=Oryza barthii TaxID=65489 RepID=A0A0D3GU92_9ORYZ
MVSTFFDLEAWFKDHSATMLFEKTHVMSPSSLTKSDASYNHAMNVACVANNTFIMDLAHGIFDGLNSLWSLISLDRIGDRSAGGSAVGKRCDDDVRARVEVAAAVLARKATCGISPLLHLFTRPHTTISTFVDLEAWFRDHSATMLFEKAHGIFDGLNSLVDVGGGHGTAALAITKAFPGISCSVLDLEQVISKSPSPSGGLVHYIVGDMFQTIPPSNVVLLKIFYSTHSDLPGYFHFTYPINS